MGASASKSATGDSAVAPRAASGTSGGDEFDVTDLLRHLQENEGYQVYDVFERAEGTRVPAPIRVWLEEDEVAATCSGASGAPWDGDMASSQVSAKAVGSFRVQVDLEPWVVLRSVGMQTSLPSLRPPPSAKSRGPPPPKAKGPPGKPPLAKAKAGASVAKKAAPPPPPFGKKLHWKLLPAASLVDTIFDELKPWDNLGGAPLDTQQLQDIFAPPERVTPQLSNTEAGASGMARRSSMPIGGGSVSRGAQGVELLTSQRAQNLAICLRTVSMPTEELSEVLRWMRLGHPISAEALEHVYENLLPPLLESTDLINYDGPPEALRDVERQLLPLARLPRLKARLQTMVFSKNMPVHNREHLTRLHALRDACAAVRNSAMLKRVFGTVLRVGNYLNHGVDAPDGGGGVEIRGFTVESLSKLRDFRAAKGSEVSAMHCVVLHLLKADEQVLAQLRSELRGVVEPIEGNMVGGGIGDLRDAVCNFQNQVDGVQVEIDRFGDCYRMEGGHTEGAGPLAVLQRLVEDAGEMARAQETAFSEALDATWRLLEFFGEHRPQPQPGGGWTDDAYASIERFFTTIREFVLSFEDCWREVLDNPRKLRLEVPWLTSARASQSVQSGGHSGVLAGGGSTREESPPGTGPGSGKGNGPAGLGTSRKDSPAESTAKKNSLALAQEAIRRRSNRAPRMVDAKGASTGDSTGVDCGWDT